jgi:hypothetical protein
MCTFLRPTLRNVWKILRDEDFRGSLAARCLDKEVVEFWVGETAKRLLGLDKFQILVNEVFCRVKERVPLDSDIRGVAWALSGSL